MGELCNRCMQGSVENPAGCWMATVIDHMNADDINFGMELVRCANFKPRPEVEKHA